MIILRVNHMQIIEKATNISISWDFGIKLEIFSDEQDFLCSATYHTDTVHKDLINV